VRKGEEKDVWGRWNGKERKTVFVENAERGRRGGCRQGQKAGGPRQLRGPHDFTFWKTLGQKRTTKPPKNSPGKPTAGKAHGMGHFTQSEMKRRKLAKS